MATTQVVSILKNAQTVLQDKTGTRWPLKELLGWYNLAQKAIVNNRPDAHARSISFDCALGTHQVLPADGLRLIKVTRNESGTKKAITLIEGRILDDQHIDWHDDSDPQSIVQHYIYDPRVPKEFYVYPAVQAGTSIKLSMSTAPIDVEIADFDTDVQTLLLDDMYVNPLLDFVLYRAYSKDIDYAGNQQRAVGHYNSFANALGIKTQSDVAMSPAKG